MTMREVYSGQRSIVFELITFVSWICALDAMSAMECYVKQSFYVLFFNS